MRLLMTTDCVGGVWTYAMDLARALAPHDVEIVLATMGPPPSDDQRTEAAALSNVQLAESRYKLEWQDDPWSDVMDAGQWLTSLERSYRPDVVHLNGFAHGGLAWDAPVVVVAHSCVMSWWRAVKREDAPTSWARYWQETRTGLQAADVVVAPTQAMLDCVRHHYGVTDRLRVISNGRRADLYRPREKEPVVLTAGRLWDEAKNLAALQRASRSVRGEVRVAGDQRIAGGGWADTTGLTALGRLTPAELADELGRAAVYALPAKYEPFGLSAVEAAMSRCALVLGDIPSLREVWGDTAAYVDPDDHYELSRAINLLLDDPTLCAARGAAARARAARYTPQRMAGQYLEVYEALRRQFLPPIEAEFERLSPELYVG